MDLIKRRLLVAILLCSFLAVLLYFFINNHTLNSGDVRKKEQATYNCPTHVERNLSEDYIISADVKMSESVQMNGFARYTATIADYDIEGLIHEIDEDAMFQIPQEKDWKQLQGINGEYLNSEIGEGWNGFSFLDSDDHYIYAALYNELDESFLAQYPMEESFDHFPIEKCDERIKDILNLFDTNSDYAITHRAMSYEVMQDNSYVLHRDDEGMDKLERNWTKQDDTYECNVFQAIDGAKLVILPWYGNAAESLDSSEILFYVTENRIVTCDVPRVFSIQGSNEYYELLDFETILDKLQIMIENKGTNGEQVKVERIEFAAAPVKNGDGTYNIRPVWVFAGHGEEIVEGDFMRWKYGIIIDAVTGDVLV